MTGIILQAILITVPAIASIVCFVYFYHTLDNPEKKITSAYYALVRQYLILSLVCFVITIIAVLGVLEGHGVFSKQNVEYNNKPVENILPRKIGQSSSIKKDNAKSAESIEEHDKMLKKFEE
ncbi:MAG TPA: hypothetical protein VKN14_05595 [Flavobacteriaceae bacterium]|nr:hypothetical protein [Flavobacteriaceae bacterium]